ncbi:carnitine 3-dehydrogenase [Granulosicoccus antarcticus]|uniref:L-carnitine dehydrogenase n=1 Tax=Granulosicoccus antarcticus IMCC3135 TaxID=1192854 RepID=A0A2Z2NXZ7_9GAMM|nr:carnitine 3-dehydrogenase [Granulosicoccus antarcticus]ASJ72637.1 L-carnitine dehydrogenase [Granulosicoccus antarcticus IMCC3135]
MSSVVETKTPIAVNTAACIGGGVIGAGWVARLIENGLSVRVYDPMPDAAARMQPVLDNADRAYAKLTMAQRPKKGELVFCASIEAAVSSAQWIIESVPERLALKQSIYAEIEEHAAVDAIIVSSTSGIMPSDLQAQMQHPGRLIVAHPFNPVYLLPVVELVAGKLTDAGIIDTARTFYSSLGMKPIHVKREIEAFVADRLLEAIWRESLWLIKDGITTTEDLDDIVRFGFGLRYAQMGVFETYRIAGGEAGMRHFLEQFGPCLTWPWTKLMDVPEYNEELVELIAGQSDQQSGHRGIRELERIRDDNLVAIQQALKANNWGAGVILADYEKKLFDAGAAVANGGTGAESEIDYSQPIRTTERRIPPDWTDYNNHMNEARYLQCFGDATDAFMRMIGCDAEYMASGGSFFTAETHIRHLDEVRVNEPVYTLTQVLMGEGKKMQLFHGLHHGDGRLLATGEHMLIHVSLETRAACVPGAAVAQELARIVALQASLPLPEGVGRAVGQVRVQARVVEQTQNPTEDNS